MDEVDNLELYDSQLEEFDYTESLEFDYTESLEFDYTESLEFDYTESLEFESDQVDPTLDSQVDVKITWIPLYMSKIENDIL